MGILVQTATGRRFTLGARNLLGRASPAIRIDEPAVSAEHGVVFYEEGAWWYRDLGSTNGTWLDGEALRPGVRHRLTTNARLELGEPTERCQWRLAADEPPAARARAVASRGLQEASHGLLELTRGPASMLVFFDDRSQRWMAETEVARFPVEDQAVVQVHDESYVLELPPASAQTERTSRVRADPAPRVGAARLAMEVSAHEEQVSLEVHVGGGALPVPSRAHHYLLLLLARRRLADRRQGGSSAEHGWVHVEELAEQLKVSRQKVNLDVSRARRQLAEMGFADAVDLVERRPQAGQLRIGGVEWEVRSA